MVTDADAGETLADTVISLAADKKKLEAMSRNIAAMAMRDSDEAIVDEILKIIDK